ncbi:hypothetical protein FOXB_10699 [Fusarium oxysporum f. sp. conglutinans Fo5176]|uniref:Uncharacterized protein n=1 Tax=Fusarium oxysporum (strain Fo5176) TaxID=660025 RepID=F9FWB7_FUSOF|nr:hypothetical protein FOXB_10699 [Fusarium oxysporum f. sp. conglutinans Fo5176]
MDRFASRKGKSTVTIAAHLLGLFEVAEDEQTLVTATYEMDIAIHDSLQWKALLLLAGTALMISSKYEENQSNQPRPKEFSYRYSNGTSGYQGHYLFCGISSTIKGAIQVTERDVTSLTKHAVLLVGARISGAEEKLYTFFIVLGLEGLSTSSHIDTQACLQRRDLSWIGF